MVISLIPLLTMGLFLGIGYSVLKIKAEVLLIGLAAMAGILAKGLGFTWSESG